MKNIRVIVPVIVCLALSFYIIGCGNATGGGGGGGGGATTIYVSKTGNDTTGTGTSDAPYLTIQKGLNMAVNNAIISVEAGIYTENLVWPSKEGITLQGAGLSSTTLDADNAGIGIKIEHFHSPNYLKIKSARIEKMTIANGAFHGLIANQGGAGIFFDYTDSTLHLFEVCVRDCSVDATTGSWNGGGIYAIYNHSGSAPFLEAVRCLIKNNTNATPGSGGGIYCTGGFISSCEISGNLCGGGGGGITISEPAGKIENSLIHHNKAAYGSGGGIQFIDNNANYEIINCTIASNEALGSGYEYGLGGGISSRGQGQVVNCIIWGNSAEAAGAFASSNEVWVKLGGDPFNFSVTYSDIKGGHIGIGNTSIGPQFTSVTDFHLTGATVSAIYAGGTLESAPACDYDGDTRPESSHLSKCSMGAYEYP